jgi:hypothetical protein
VRVVFDGGGSDEETVRIAKGSPARPLTGAECLTKFLEGASAVLGTGAGRIPDVVASLETAATVRDLCTSLVPT